MAVDPDKIIHRSGGPEKIFPGGVISGVKRAGRPPGPWDCSVCGLPVGKDGLAKGAGRLIEQHVYCNTCLAKRQAGREAVKRPLIWTALALAALAALLLLAFVFAITPLFFAGLALGILVLATGALGFGLPRKTRLRLALGGVLLMAACWWGMLNAEEYAEKQTAVKAVNSKLLEIQELLKHDDFARAAGRLPLLRAKALSEGTPQAARTAHDAQAALDAWLDKNFAGLDEPLRAEIQSLLALYPFKTPSGARFFQNPRLEEKTFIMTLAVSWNPAAVARPKGPAAQVDGETLSTALGIALDMLRGVPAATAAELNLINDKTDEELGTLRLSREALSRLGTRQIEDILPLFKQKS